MPGRGDKGRDRKEAEMTRLIRSNEIRSWEVDKDGLAAGVGKL